jgi:choline-glycine betaine transporter
MDMKKNRGRIIQLLVCLIIGGMVAVFIINPWQAQETAKNISYVVNKDNNWLYVCSQFALMVAFVLMGFLYGVKDGRRKT